MKVPAQKKPLDRLTEAQQRLLFDAYDHETRGHCGPYMYFPIGRRGRAADKLFDLGLCNFREIRDFWGRLRWHLVLDDRARHYAHRRDPKIVKTKLTPAQFALLKNAVYGTGKVGRRVRSAKALEALELGTTDGSFFLPNDLGKAVVEAEDWDRFECKCPNCTSLRNARAA